MKENNFERSKENIQEVECSECHKVVEVHTTAGWKAERVDPETFVCGICQMKKNGSLAKIVEENRLDKEKD